MGSSGVGAGLGLVARIAAVGGCCLALAHCGQAPGRLDPKYGVSASPRLVALGEPVPKGGGTYRIGKPYTVGGQTYNPEENPAGYSSEGIASWYGEDFHGRQTANGEIYDMTSISAAHPTLPIPSYARVTNLANHRSIIVRINDRGPYHQGRLIDVSARTAKLLGFYDVGTARVRVDYVGRASLAGSDDAKLEATLRQGTPAPGPGEIRLASAHSARPHYAEAAVPVPPDRPFELGQNQPPDRFAIKVPSNKVAAVTRAPGAATFAARFEPAESLPVAPQQPVSVSAFAPTAAADGAVLSGRGLY